MLLAEDYRFIHPEMTYLGDSWLDHELSLASFWIARNFEECIRLLAVVQRVRA